MTALNVWNILQMFIKYRTTLVSTDLWWLPIAHKCSIFKCCNKKHQADSLKNLLAWPTLQKKRKKWMKNDGKNKNWKVHILPNPRLMLRFMRFLPYWLPKKQSVKYSEGENFVASEEFLVERLHLPLQIICQSNPLKQGTRSVSSLLQKLLLNLSLRSVLDRSLNHCSGVRCWLNMGFKYVGGIQGMI